MEKNKGLGILLMAYGAPQSLEEIEPYLKDIREGRPSSPEFVAEIRERYRAIGGKSPLLDITLEQAKRLKDHLHLSRLKCRVFVGMRHSKPFINETVEAMKKEGLTRLTALCMSPYNSALSVGAYRKKLADALKASSVSWPCQFLSSWHDEPDLIDAFADKIRKARRQFPSRDHDKIQVIFSAHSLPEKILKMNDPYPKQLLETSRLTAQKAGLIPGQWYFAYQSKSKTGEPWLGPDAGDIIDRLAQEGKKHLVLSPIGFIADHLETLYDADILYRRQAESRGMQFARTESLNAAPGLISAMANTILRQSRKTSKVS